MIISAIFVIFFTSAAFLWYDWQNYLVLPKLIPIVIVIGSIITFLFVGIGFSDIHILDIKHPVYSDQMGGIGTFSILLSIAGGVTLAAPITITYGILRMTIDYRRERKMKKKLKERK